MFSQPRICVTTIRMFETASKSFARISSISKTASMISRLPLVIKRTSPALPDPPAHKVRLDRRVILVIAVPLVSLGRPVPQALPVHKVTRDLSDHAVLTELPVLSDHKVT